MKLKTYKLRKLTQSISLALIASTTAHSAEFIVTTTGDDGGGTANEISTGVFEIDTLRSAIELADEEDTFPGADIVSFSPSLFNTGETVINLNNIGDSNTFLSTTSYSALGINSAITVVGPVNETLILSAGDLRHFQLNNGARLNISHVTLDGGFTPPEASGRGGAIYADGDVVLNMSHCTLSNNESTRGGALFIDSSNAVSRSSIEYSYFIGNQAKQSNSGSSGRYGGAISASNNSLPLYISHSTFTENEAIRGGGVIFNSGQLVINASTLHNNTAGFSGGAIDGNNQGVLTLTNSTVANNKSGGSGGGIEISTDSGEAVSSIINSTITGNQSLFDQSPEEQQQNESQRRGGGYIYFDTSGGGLSVEDYADTTIIHNSIIDGNTETTAMLADDIAASPLPESSHNFIGAGDSVLAITDGTNGNQIGIRDVPIDADLQPLADNGGFTLTQLPNLGSPVIDAGDDALCESVDQLGALRPADGDLDGSAVCDIGAVEVGGIPDLIFKDGFNE